MTTQPLIRKIALWLTRSASRAVRRSHNEWADAMLSEVSHIESDGEALRWAFGCVCAAVMQSARARPLELLPIRALVLLLLLQQILNDLFSPTVLVAYKTGLVGLAHQLGRLTPANDYRPYVPLLNSVPVGLYAVWVIGAVLYLMSAIRYVRRRPNAFLFFVAAFVIDAIAWIAVQPYYAVAHIGGDAVATSALGVFEECAAAVTMWVLLWQADSAAVKTES